jgi:hypothetical protein
VKRASATAILVSLLASGGVLAGCANKTARTQEFYTPADGVNAEAGQIAIRNVLAVRGEDGTSLLATFVPRNSPDELVRVTIGGEEAVLTPTSVELPAGAGVTVGVAELSAVVDGLDPELGTTTEIGFTFGEAPAATVQAIVLPVEEVYGTNSPTPPSSTASPGATQPGTIEPTPTFTESSATPSPTATG